MNKRWPFRKSKHAGKKRVMGQVKTDNGKVVTFYRKGSKMSRFWDLLKDSTLTQGAVTLALTLTVCYLALTGQAVPELVGYSFSSAIGFFFGAKIQQSLRR